MKRVDAANGLESLNQVTFGFGQPSTLQANEILLPSSILTPCNGIRNFGGCEFGWSLLCPLRDSRGLSKYLKASGLVIGVLSTPDLDGCLLDCCVDGRSKYLKASGLTIGVVSM